MYVGEGEMINERKVADMAAYLLLKEGGQMKYMKLIKLMYFSDKEHIKKYSHPISYDKPYSMKHGPILSETLNLIKRKQSSKPYGWGSRIAKADLDNYTVSVKEGITLKDLGKLSKADRWTMDDIWDKPGCVNGELKKLGEMTQWELKDYAHENCPEWEDPEGPEWKYEDSKSAPIKLKALCDSLNFDKDDIQGVKANIDEAQDFIATQNYISYR